MNITENIESLISEHFNTRLTDIKEIGKGASGQVYCIHLSSAPYKIAVKLSKHYDLLQQEKEMLEYLKPRVAYQVPETYFIGQDGGVAFLVMEFISGISGNSKKMLLLPKKKHLVDNIINALTETQKTTSNKFGSYNNPEYNSWKEYYSAFFAKIYSFSKEQFNDGKLSKTVIEALELISENFDKVFKEDIKKSYLCHGDFWMCNMLIDFKKGELSAVLDPFNVIWAEPEYELFALTLGYGKMLKLYENYKSKCKVSEYCDLKIELYALCNELDWYMRLGSISHDYLEYRAERLKKEFKKIH